MAIGVSHNGVNDHPVLSTAAARLAQNPTVAPDLDSASAKRTEKR